MEASSRSEDQALAWRGSFLARLSGGRRSYWIVVAAAAAITGLVVAAVAGLAGGGPVIGRAHPSGWWSPKPSRAGQPLDEHNTEARRYPALTLPPEAVGTLNGDEVASSALHPGDVVTAARLGGLPIGDRSEVAIPAHTALPPLAPGDLAHLGPGRRPIPGHPHCGHRCGCHRYS